MTEQLGECEDCAKFNMCNKPEKRRGDGCPEWEEDVRIGVLKLWDCRHKDFMVLRRRGGDFAIEFYDASGKYLFSEWFEMKRPHKETYAKITTLIFGINKLLEPR